MKYIRGIDYDVNKDYTKEMQKAKDKGDLELLRELEMERNKKIEGENLPYRKTYTHIDLGTEIERAIKNREDKFYVKELTDARRDKAKQNKEYDAYKDDEIQKRGYKYYFDEESGAGYGYDNRPTRKNTYKGKIESLINKISNGKEFSYDPENDPVYKAMKEEAYNSSRRIASDILVNLTQMGGGENSYAHQAAQKAASDALMGLSERMPELYSLAYENFKDKEKKSVDALEYYLNEDKKEEEKYLSDLKQYEADRKFANERYESKTEELEAQDKADEDVKNKLRELVKYYEEQGVPASKELLELSGIGEEENRKSAKTHKESIDVANNLKKAQTNNYLLKQSKASSQKTKTEGKTEEKTEKEKTEKEKTEEEKYRELIKMILELRNKIEGKETKYLNYPLAHKYNYPWVGLNTVQSDFEYFLKKKAKEKEKEQE